MYNFTPDTIYNAWKNLNFLDPKVGGLFCILSCAEKDITVNKTYEINGSKLRKNLSYVFDWEYKNDFDNAKPCFVIFAKNWYNTFFNNDIGTHIDLLSCSVFFLRRFQFSQKPTTEEIIKLFIDKFNLENYKDLWFDNSKELILNFNENETEKNQKDFYLKITTEPFKSVTFNDTLKKCAYDLSAAGHIQTLYSAKGILKTCIYSDESLDNYYSMQETTTNKVNKINKPYNRIIFGAPGTGKSNKLKDESIAFTSQEEIKTDITTQIQAEVNAAKEKKNFKALFNAIGLKYADKLPDTNKEIKVQFGDNTYEIYVGVKASKVIKKYQEQKALYEQTEDNSVYDNIKTELDKITTGIEQNVDALGFVYGSFLCDFSLNEINTKFELNPKESKGYWLQKGAQAFICYEEQKQQEKIKYLERVTFHPNYSYAQFVGTYKPVQNQENLDEIRYEYVPGPFMRTYVNAINHKDKDFLLLIEEINRANVAAVFGDVFQLLDRKNDGTSEYPITASEDIKKYLSLNGIKQVEISIPENMYIWATMNSADQGVLPMDAAFKRRWDFEYIGINKNESWDYTIPLPNGESINWNTLRKAINAKLKTVSGVNEDKLLGPYFISKSVLDKFTKGKTPTEDEKTNFIDTFKSKVLMYLFEDVCKMRPTDLFTRIEGLEEGQNRPHYSDICNNFDKIGIEIFGWNKADIEAKYPDPNKKASE